MRRLWLLLVIGLLASCAAAPTPTTVPTPTPPASLWGAIHEIARTEQADAPAMWVAGERVTFLWVGAEEDGVHHDMRAFSDVGFSPRIVQPLPPTHPFDQRLLPAFRGGLHIFWLDAAPDADPPELRLYGAFTLFDMTLDRGPTPLSDTLTLRYSAAPAQDDGAWVVWSGGLLAEPRLYSRLVDPVGRPRPPQQLVDNADWPVLLRALDGSYTLFWLDATRENAYYAPFHGETIGTIYELAPAPTLNTGDRLMGFWVGQDLTHAYLFWNITRFDGQYETWWTSGRLDGGGWPAPQQLTLSVDTSQTVQTGYNSGVVYAAASNGSDRAVWAYPAIQQADVLPSVAQVNDQLAVLYFRDGDLLGYQALTPIRGLIGHPHLMADGLRHLYVTWSEPQPDGRAALQMTTTRP